MKAVRQQGKRAYEPLPLEEYSDGPSGWFVIGMVVVIFMVAALTCVVVKIA